MCVDIDKRSKHQHLTLAFGECVRGDLDHGHTHIRVILDIYFMTLGLIYVFIAACIPYMNIENVRVIAAL